MYLAGKLSKFDVVDWEGRRPEHLRWWDMFVQDMSIEILEDICHQVLDMYSQNQPTPPDSPQQNAMKMNNNVHSPSNMSPLTNFVTPQGTELAASYQIESI